MHVDRVARTGALVAVAACIAALTTTLGLLARDRISVWLDGEGRAATTYRPGDRIDLAPETYEGAPYTLLVFARSDCAACEQSKPALITLIRDVRAIEGIDVALITTAVRLPEGTQLAEAIGLSPADVIPVETSRIRVQRVPALALVDREGEVLSFHEGVLTETARASISDVASRLTEHR